MSPLLPVRMLAICAAASCSLMASANPSGPGAAGPVTRDGNRFSAEGWAEGSLDACAWARTWSYVATTSACQEARFVDCGEFEVLVLEKTEFSCRVRMTVWPTSP